MSEVYKIAFRLQKAFTPTVHVLVAKVLFTYMVTTVVRERRDPRAVNAELFRQGIWGGSLALLNLAPADTLRRLWKPEPSGVAKFIEVLSSAAWYIFAGHMPSVRTEVLDERGIVWVEVEEAPGKDAFYKVEVPEGVNTLYFVAGAYEGATQTAYRLLGVEGQWLSMWRPLDTGGICGFHARRDLDPREVIEAAKRKRGSFFDLISWNDSASMLEEVLGVSIPRA
jgi:hypothetical protein